MKDNAFNAKDGRWFFKSAPSVGGEAKGGSSVLSCAGSNERWRLIFFHNMIKKLL